jgi:hypothetical protein
MLWNKGTIAKKQPTLWNEILKTKIHSRSQNVLKIEHSQPDYGNS